MSPLVVLLLALQARSLARPPDVTHEANVSSMNPLPNGGSDVTVNGSAVTEVPALSVIKLRQRRQVQFPSLVAGLGTNLEWVTWESSLPNFTVSIYNSYVGRVDYVCKHKCDAGFYNPQLGPFCHYADTKAAYKGAPFQILVNQDNFDIVEWTQDSSGSVPPHSVRTCSGEGAYVGKNKYGLGGVVMQSKAFLLPWKGSVYSYSYYQVLTINTNVYSQQIYDVKYNLNETKIIDYPPEVMRKTAIRNYECRPVFKTDTLKKTYQVEQRWTSTSSVALGVKTSITAGIPFIVSTAVEISSEVTLQFSKEYTVSETITDSVSVELTAPANTACGVSMVRKVYNIRIPFTARLSRTYGNGEVRTTDISGTYDSIQTGEVLAVVDRCELLDQSTACP